MPDLCCHLVGIRESLNMVLHFLRPYWFIALLPLFLLCWRANKLSLAENWRLVCDEHLLSQLLITSKHKPRLQVMLLLLGGIIAIFALAGPSWQKQEQPVYRSQIGRVLVLNLSPSMADLMGTTKKIDRARFKMLDYLNLQKEGMTGLVVYTDEAHTITPLTEDNKTIANFIPYLDPNIMPTYNDDTVIGLQEAEKLLKQAGLHQGNVVLITDKITHSYKAQQAASELLEKGFRLYILNLSGKTGLNSEMQQLAAAGGGKVISLTPNNKDIEELVAKTQVKLFVPPTKKSEQKGFIWQDNGRFLVFLLLPLALLAFRRGYI